MRRNHDPGGQKPLTLEKEEVRAVSGPSILEYIGNTPLVALQRINPNPAVQLLAKLEYMNPGGSIKDRAALFMVEAGEKSGELKPGKTVIEATSGNTGIGLALVCAVKGYRLLLTMSESVSEERRKILRARGAEILLTPSHLGTDGAIEEAYHLARENPDRYFMTDQFNNPANWQAHYHGTALEIWEQTGHCVDKIVATLGTSGTLMGISRRMKTLAPSVKIIGVEPFLGHKIQGLKNMKESYRPEIFEKNRLDKTINVEDEQAFEMTRRLAVEEGLFLGMSSGAAVAAAVDEAARMNGGTLVVILPDGGERYLSTPLFTVKNKIELHLFNTMTRVKDRFEPAHPGKVSMYSCGLTANQRMHLGECRRFVFADLLSRYLSYRGYAVKHIINITDLDDKTIAGSQAAGVPLSRFTGSHIRRFLSDLEMLGVQPADSYPRASDHTQDMVALAEKLVQKGFAYEKLRSLYFNISRFSGYGRLSGIDIDKIRLGATVDLDEYEKDNPRDFTLFKRAKLSELKRGIFVKTPWGNARPSWHIQCAAMAMKYLGETYDIHTAGRELVFPHHENEIAIAEAVTGKTPAAYWIHCDRVLVNGKKMDEHGAGLTVPDLMDQGCTGREIRYWLLCGHYRRPIVFSMSKLANARRSLQRMDRFTAGLFNLGNSRGYPEIDQLLYDIKNGFTAAMDDDLNISAALASLFRMIKKINILMADARLNAADAKKILSVFAKIDSVLNVLHFPSPPVNDGVRALLQKREQARQRKDWRTADVIRDELLRRGVTVRDASVKKTRL